MAAGRAADLGSLKTPQIFFLIRQSTRALIIFVFYRIAHCSPLSLKRWHLLIVPFHQKVMIYPNNFIARCTTGDSETCHIREALQSHHACALEPPCWREDAWFHLVLRNGRKQLPAFAAPLSIVGVVFTILGNNCSDPLSSELKSSQFLVVGYAREGPEAGHCCLRRGNQPIQWHEMFSGHQVIVWTLPDSDMKGS